MTISIRFLSLLFHCKYFVEEFIRFDIRNWIHRLFSHKLRRLDKEIFIQILEC